jgi:hypothetical protein
MERANIKDLLIEIVTFLTLLLEIIEQELEGLPHYKFNDFFPTLF